MARTALVFGHTSGLGLAIAKKLLEDDYHIVGISRSQSSLPTVKVTDITADLSKKQDVYAVLDAVKQNHPKFNILIFAVGTLTAHDINNVDYDEMERLYKVNTFAPMFLESRLLDLIKQNGADVVNVTSSALVDYYPKFAEYSSAKAAFAKFTKDLTKELKDTSCRVTEVCPSGFKSNIYKTMSGDKIDRDESKQMETSDLAGLIKCVIDLPKKMEVSYLYVDRK